VWAWRGSNFGFLHWLASSPLQHSRTTVRVCDLTTAQQKLKSAREFQIQIAFYFNNKCIGDDTQAADRQSLNCIKNKKMRKTISNMADGILTPCNVARSWHWFRQVTATRVMWHVALESWQRILEVAAPCSVIRGSGMTCHWIRPNVRYVGILHLVSISTTSPQSTCHSAPVSEFDPNRTTLGRKNDVMSIFKMADLSRLGF